MYIAGTNDDVQGGICYGGIAHAGPVRYQRAMWCDGSNDCLTRAALPITATFSFAARIFLMSHITLSGIMCNNAGVTNATNAEMGIFAGKLRIWHKGKYSLGPAIALRTWYHVGVSFDGISAAAYINGEYTKLAGPIESTIVYPNLFAIGRDAYSSPYLFNGVIHNVCCADRALSPAEFLALSQHTMVDDVLYYSEGNGNTLLDWQDESGNNNNMTMILGSPDPAYIRGDDKIIVNGVIMNP